LKRFSQLLQNVFDRSRQHYSPIGAGSGRGCTVGRCYRRSHEQDDHGGEQDGGHSGFGSHCAALLIDRSLSRVGHAVLWATHRVFIRASATAAIRKRAMDHQLFSQLRVAVRGAAYPRLARTHVAKFGSSPSILVREGSAPKVKKHKIYEHTLTESIAAYIRRRLGRRDLHGYCKYVRIICTPIYSVRV